MVDLQAFLKPLNDDDTAMRMAPPKSDFLDEATTLLAALTEYDVRMNRYVRSSVVHLELHQDGQVEAVCQCIDAVKVITEMHIKPLATTLRQRNLKRAFLLTTGTVDEAVRKRAHDQGVVIYDAPRLARLREKASAG